MFEIVAAFSFFKPFWRPAQEAFQFFDIAFLRNVGSVLLGGVKRLSEARKEYGVPMVNKIPYLKRLFSNTSVGRDTESLMMMVTPHIIIQEEYEDSMANSVARQ